METVSSLPYGDAGADYLFNSSTGRWNGSLGNAVVGLELLALSSGLNIANEMGMNIFSQVGDIYTVYTHFLD